MRINSLKGAWGNLDPKGQLTLVGAALLVVATLVVLFTYASRPSYATLAGNLEPGDAGEITQALESAGIAYELRSGGTEIAVQDGQTAPARVALAEAGLPRGSHVGFELFDKKSLGATDFQQKVDYQRALEGEVARTIEKIDGVRGAQVQLVLPEETLFADDGAKASAAVLLQAGDAIDASTVAGIAHLVSSSVKGLAADDVTITDERGTLLWPDGSGASGGLSASSRLRSEQLYAAQLSAQINGMLAATLGPDKAQARVRASLDLDSTTVDKVTYAKKGTALAVERKEETLKSEGAPTGGAAGTATNIPSYSAAAAGGGKSDYENTTDSTQYGVDKTVERRQVAPGEARRVDVALLVDKGVPQAQVQALEAAVRSMAGIDADRGDTVAVSRVAFVKPAAPAAPEPGGVAAMLADPIGIAKWAGLSMGALIFLLLMRKNLRRREGEGVAPEPTWLREIEGTMPLAALEGGARALEAPSNGQRDLLRNEVEEIAKSQPEQIAAQMSTWLKD